MGKILEAFASNHLIVEPTLYEGSAEYKKAKHLYCELGDQLLMKLNDEEKELFEQYVDAQREESILYANDRFVSGYRLGVMMTMEVYSDQDNLLIEKSA